MVAANRYYKIFRHVIARYSMQSLPDQSLLMKAAILLLFLRISLHAFPFHKLYPAVKLFLKKPIYSYTRNESYTEKVIWAVEKTGKYLQRKNRCLPQALAVQILLNKKRIMSDIQIGFIIIKHKTTAHAWVRAEERILIGGNQSLHLYFEIPFQANAPSWTSLI